MKRSFDSFIEFTVSTSTDVFSMFFSYEWRFNDMLDFMVKSYSIDVDSIVEIRNTFIKRYKLCKYD